MARPLNDEPTLDDRLKRFEVVRRLGNAIATCDPPQVFGLLGDWGAGKTSLLHQLHCHLAGECPQNLIPAGDRPPLRRDSQHVTVIWFEAWRYQYESTPIVALLQEIRTQLPWYSKALNEGKKLGEVAVQSALMSIEDLTKRIGVQASKIQSAGEKWEKDHYAFTLPSHAIRAQLERAVEQLLGQRKDESTSRRIAVLIDDLDRCDPLAAFQLLEGIKIYLNLPSFVFVLGMNQTVIERALAKYLKDEDNKERVDRDHPESRAREYFEKLCQDIWHLPALANAGAYFEHCLENQIASVEMRTALRLLAEQTECLPPNPRRIKTLANVVGRYADLKVQRPASALPCRHDLLVLFVASLYQYHPELYRLLECYPEFLGQIEKFVKGKPTRHAVFDRIKRLDEPPKDQPSSEEKTSAPESASPLAADTPLVPSYPDPTRGNVFRLQKLWNMLEREYKDENGHGEVTTDEIKLYLIR